MPKVKFNVSFDMDTNKSSFLVEEPVLHSSLPLEEIDVNFEGVNASDGMMEALDEVSLYAYIDAQEPDEKLRWIVRNCVANQAMEGLHCTKDDADALLRIVRDETTVDAEVAKILAKYRKIE